MRCTQLNTNTIKYVLKHGDLVMTLSRIMWRPLTLTSSLGRKWSCHRSFASAAKEAEIILPNGPPLRLSFGKLAKFADGNCVASIGQTCVLTTAVCKSNNAPANSFVPLTVDYRQKSAAAGRIPTNFLRRDTGTSEKEILTGRVVDRSIRPLFPKGFGSDTQIVCNLLAVDGHFAPDVAALNAASAALATSDIPWRGPVGAVRVGYDPELKTFKINPNRKELSQSKLNLIVSGTADGKVVMLEGEANVLEKDLFYDAIEFGVESCAVIAKEIQKISADCVKRELPPVLDIPSELRVDMELMCLQRIKAIFCDDQHDKTSRDVATFGIRDEVVSDLKTKYPNLDSSVFMQCFNVITRSLVASLILDEGRRVDGRGFNQLRNITCDTNLHPPLHGSALFQRGQTQVFCTVALDSVESALKSDPVSVLTGAVKEKNFFLHYEFPPYATNEIGRAGFAGRRELGHGALAEKALRPLIPTDYPFTIRLTSEVLESNGSSSMASICGGTLALLDAGVPVSDSAAGVAVGLVTELDQNGEIGRYQTLMDILGLEDYLGDMDFKVAGTRNGITALQADIKLAGISLNIVKDALDKGQDGINQILNIMGEKLSSPRTDKSNLPIVEEIEVPTTKRSKLVGVGGIQLRKIRSETGVQMTPVSDTVWSAFAPNSEAMTEAKDMIKEVLEVDDRVPEYEFGSVVTVTIVEVKEKGILVELHPNLEPVFIPVSQLSATKVTNTSALDLKLGDTMQVKYFGREPKTGSIRLSRKVLLVSSSGAVTMLNKSTRRKIEPDSPKTSLSRKTESDSSKKSLIQNLEFETEESLLITNNDINIEKEPVLMKSVPNEDEQYYNMDVSLNELMLVQRDLSESEERLEEVKEEIEKSKRNFVFFKETSFANKNLAEVFMMQSHEKLIQLLSKKKAIEETVRNHKQNYKECQIRFQKARKHFMKEGKLEVQKTLQDKESKFKFEEGKVYVATISQILETGLCVQLKRDKNITIFVHHRWIRLTSEPLVNVNVSLKCLGEDEISGKMRFLVRDAQKIVVKKSDFQQSKIDDLMKSFRNWSFRGRNNKS